MKIPDRIKGLRTKNKMTQKELSKELGVSVVTIQCWENGTKNPSMSAIVLLAKLFKISTDYLLGVTHNENADISLLSSSEQKLLENYRILDKHGKKAVEAICGIEKSRVLAERTRETDIIELKPDVKPSRYIPHFTTPAAAGISAPIEGDDYEMIPVDDSVPQGADFAVSIQGDSMYPFIHDGDIVYVKRDCELQIGDVGIFCVNGATYCKQYYIDDERNLTLLSANPDLQYTNVYVDTESDSSVVCYGKVLLDIKMTLPDYFIQPE